MKKIYSLLVLTALFCLNVGHAFSQQSGNCPGCIPDPNCTITPAFPNLCPEALPSDSVGNYYDNVMQFYMPSNFDDPGTGFNVDLIWVEVLDIVNVPFGLDWTLDIYPNDTYYPIDNPPTTEHGCVRVCGTPILPFNDSIQVFVKVFVDAGITTQELVQSFKVGLTIHPSGSGNASFTVSNPAACAPVVTDFTTNFPSGGNPGFSYDWDFGNGFTSNSETPPSITYTDTGDYQVTCHTVVDTLPYTLSNVEVLGAPCNDNPWSDPDFYFILFENGNEILNTLSTFGSVADQAPPVEIPFSPLTTSDVTYTLEIWEEDGGLLGGNDQCGSVSFNGYDDGVLSLNDGNGLFVEVTINHDVIEFYDTATVTVYPNPEKPNLTGSADTICLTDTVFLSTTSGTMYQWWNDTLLLAGLDTNEITTVDSGLYWVLVTNSYGCTNVSEYFPVTVLENPPNPTFYPIGNTLNCPLTGYNLQWFYDGDSLIGETGSTYEMQASGSYYITATNYFGCSTQSQTTELSYTPSDTTGIEEYSIKDFSLFPNPNTGAFNLSFHVDDLSQLSIIVNDMLGRVVFERKLSDFKGTFNQKIDLEDAEQGIYIVSVLNNNKYEVKTKVVVD